MALCEKCKINQATVRVTEIINGQKYQYFLCSQCAQKNNLVNHYVNMMNSPAWVSQASRNHSSAAGAKCEACGFTYEQFLQTGYLGCPECYDAFRQLLQPTIRKIQHGNEIHRGLRPLGGVKVPDSEEVTDPVIMLKKKLEEAVEKEEYELAAQLRDEIRALNHEGGNS